MAAESLVAGNAYVISSINVVPADPINPNAEYSLVPQVVVYDGSSEYIGSVTKFSGCYNGKLYDQSEYKGACLTGVVNSLASTSTTDALSAAKGKELQDQINELKNLVSSLQSNPPTNFDKVYPVGSIYMSTSNTNPHDLFGGTWEALDDGRVLIGANSSYPAGTTGGEVSHTLTENEMPSHKHNIVKPIAMPTGANDILNINDSNFDALLGTDNFKRYESYGDAYNGVEVPNYGYTDSIGYSGGGVAHNNMQPYLSVYM